MKTSQVCIVLVLTLLPVVLPGLQEYRSKRKSDQSLARQDQRKVACPKLRFRRRGCTSRYECKQECKEKKKCKTTYKYQCKDYRRQECKNVWQNQCNGKKGRGRRKRSPRRPYWLDTEIIYDTQNYPLEASDIPFASPTQGQVFEFASEPRSKRCWRRVRKCEWKTYRSSCGNRPTTTCEDKLVTECKKKCKNVYYCDKCPTSKPKPTKKPSKPVGPKPTKRPRPSTARPSRPGPPAIPPPGTFIGPPGTPVKQDVELPIIDARRRKVP